MNAREMRAALAAPFPPEQLEWRPGSTNQDKTRAMALAYIQSRAVMDRLDDVCGIGEWWDTYASGPDGGVICGLTLVVEGKEVTKWDGAENTDVEAVKGGLSDALKRAGVKWGIGRYLYDLPTVWVACEQRGKTVVLKETPQLPPWALPVGDTPPPARTPQQRPQNAPQSTLPPVPTLSIKQLWTLLGEIGLSDMPSKADAIGWAIDWNPVDLTTQIKIHEAVTAWAIREGITEDVEMKLVDRIKGRKGEAS